MNFKATGNTYTLSVGNTQISNISAVCVWRYPGEEWKVEKAGFCAINESEKGVSLDYSFTCMDAKIDIEYGDEEVRYSGNITHRGGKAVELARFHVLEGDMANDFSFRAYQSVTGSTVVYTNADQLKPFRIHHEEMWQSWAEYWLRLEEPYHDEPNWAVAGDIGHFFNKKNEFSIGFYAPGSAAGEVGYKTQCEGDSTVYGAVLLDNILFEEGDERVLEKCAIIHNGGNAAFDRWADLCTEMAKPRESKPYLGYCSWYLKFSNIEEGDIIQAANEYADLTNVNIPVVLQIDDGFQLMSGTFDRPNKKFESTYTKLPGMISEKGLVPGLWLAPLPVWCEHPMIKEDPTMVQRAADGSYPIKFCNWNWSDPTVENPTSYFLDPGHPKVKDHIYKMVKDAVNAGWKYLKIDFTYCISERRAAYDRKHTVFEQHRDIWRIAREAAGEDIIICACICGLFRHSIGYADTQRIGGDVTANVDSFKRSLPDCITRASTGGKWWTADTDVFYMRSVDGLGLEQKWIWTGTVGAIGSVFLTSDFVTQWGEEELERIRYYWKDDGVAPPEKIKTVQAEDNSITAIYVKNKFCERVLVYNWEDKDAEITADISSFGLKGQPKAAFPNDISVKYNDGKLTCSSLKPFSMRIIEF